MWPFRPSPAKTLAKARAELVAATDARIDAEDRGNTQLMRSTRARVTAAVHALMAAEQAVEKLPPMPRRGVSA